MDGWADIWGSLLLLPPPSPPPVDGFCPVSLTSSAAGLPFFVLALYFLDSNLAFSLAEERC